MNEAVAKQRLQPELLLHPDLSHRAAKPMGALHDVILTIVDHRCSRGTIFLPCTTTIMGPQIAKLYLNHLYQWFGLPKQIISDRDP